MNDVLKKIGWKAGMGFYLANCPEAAFSKFSNADPVTKGLSGKFPLVLGFVRGAYELPTIWKQLQEASNGERIWIAYPKKSGRIVTDITRDKGWEVVTDSGYRGVSQVSIDQDWSCLRFKQAEAVQSKPKGLYSEAPPELVSLLNDYPDERSYYESLAPSHKKEYNQWIAEAKKVETRERRLKKTIEYLRAAKKNPYSS